MKDPIDQEPRKPHPAETELLIVTGMSGAGRRTAIHQLEDSGWFVVDNLPPQMLSTLVDLRDTARRRHDPVTVAHQQVAVGVDVRSGAWFDDLGKALTHMTGQGIRPSLIFFDATDEALVRRFESVRRPHPLQGEGRLLDAIQRERAQLMNLRSMADVVIDTSGLTVHQLSAKINSLFAGEERSTLRLAVMSFGFKYGVPLDSDIVFDMRFLPNPFWMPELRPLNGRDEPVAEFVMEQPGAQDFLDRAEALLSTMVDGYDREGRRYVTVGIGCTGGKHRSVAMAERLAARMKNGAVNTFVVHRDLGRE